MSATKRQETPSASDGQPGQVKRWEMRLYVAGRTPKSVAAFANLKRICGEHVQGRYHVEVIDLLEHPQLAKGDQIIAAPTLVKTLPPPVRKVIGNMGDPGRILVVLGIAAGSLGRR